MHYGAQVESGARSNRRKRHARGLIPDCDHHAFDAFTTKSGEMVAAKKNRQAGSAAWYLHVRIFKEGHRVRKFLADVWRREPPRRDRLHPTTQFSKQINPNLSFNKT